MIVELDPDLFYAFLLEKKKEMEQFGSIIFPMKGGETFEAAKVTLKERLKFVKRIIKEIDEQRTKRNNLSGV